MDSHWTSIVFGLPAVALGIAVALVGFFRRAWWIFALGVLLVAPFSIYVGVVPRFWGLPFLGFLSLAGAPFALLEERKTLAWGMVAAYLVTISWPIAVVILVTGK